MAQDCIIYQITALDVARNQIKDKDLVANELWWQEMQTNLAQHPMHKFWQAGWICNEPVLEC